jgi:hypothetical protein
MVGREHGYSYSVIFVNFVNLCWEEMKILEVRFLFLAIHICICDILIREMPTYH